MPSKVMLKMFEILKESIFLILIIIVKYFHCVSKIFPVLQQNFLYISCLDKLRPNFRFFIEQ